MSTKLTGSVVPKTSPALPPDPHPWLIWSLLYATLALIAAVGAIAISDRSSLVSGAQQLTATSALALIGAVAVAIERIIEGFWTFVGFAADSWWPLLNIRVHINTFIAESNAALVSYQTDAKAFVSQIEGKVSAAQKQLYQAQQDLTNPQPVDPSTPEAARIQPTQLQLDQAREELRGLLAVQAKNREISSVLDTIAFMPMKGVRNSQGVRLTAAQMTGTIDTLRNLLPQLQTQAALAQQSVSMLVNVVDTFTDNPARRLISMYIGAFIGLGAAASFQLDLFQAILNPDRPITGIGIALTGLVIGLGANPTHEVIRLLEEFKKSRKTQNNDTASNA